MHMIDFLKNEVYEWPASSRLSNSIDASIIQFPAKDKIYSIQTTRLLEIMTRPTQSKQLRLTIMMKPNKLLCGSLNCDLSRWFSGFSGTR